ncbi:MAG: FtsX-like permease family protein [Candidatus Neomarinimicrobiota bacterium]
MIKFLYKGLMRDKNRSFYPIIVVALGVWLVVFFQAYITGFMGEWIDSSARFETGHVKITTRAFAENADQNPNDLAIIGVDEIISRLEQEYPDMVWVERVHYGGLFDVPDEQGETRSQSPIFGYGIDLLSSGTVEIENMNIENALVRGKMPERSGEILISDDLANKLGIDIGGNATLLSSTMYGSMAMHNFIVSGTLTFGMQAMDRGAMIADINDIQSALDMENSAGQILGYLPNNIYDIEQAETIKQNFNDSYTDPEDEFSPIMMQLKDLGMLGDYLELTSSFSVILATIFIVLMSIVLWNVGLLGGIRRYGEVGLRLAIGEHKGHIYRSMIYESVLIGFVGSLIGTMLGLAFAYWLQVKGINIGDMMKNSTMLFPGVIHAKITTETYYLGFIPGLFSMVLGTMLSGVGIYRRQTAQLFKELEV